MEIFLLARSRLVGRLVMSGVCLLLLTACADGYPSDDEGLFLHFGMNRQETERAMNSIGAHRYLAQPWRYTITPQCEVVVASGKLLRKRPQALVPLRGTKASLMQEEEPTRYTVAVRTLAEPANPAWTLIEGANRIDATRIRWLAEYVPMLCETQKAVPA